MAAQPSKAHDAGQAAAALLRRLPSVDRVLDLPAVAAWAAETRFGRAFVTRAINAHLDEIRDRVLSGLVDENSLEMSLNDLPSGVARTAARLAELQLRPVVNATGVIVHTNLGRSPWSAAAAERSAGLSQRYLNLEFDLAGGGRGQRAVAVERLIEQLLPGCAAAVVNNNAAAVLLVLNTLAPGREVVVSRGQLVEIGGSFRIPEVMSKSQSILREVGTTNRTRLSDYEAAIGPNTGALLSVHPSNYRVVGFTEEVDLADLVELGERSDTPVIEDLGSGCFIDLAELGIQGEPTVAQRVASGVDLLTFSGDKILGGPQAGFIVGKPELVARTRSNPLYRALRLDKSTTLALEATLATYVTGRLDEIPTVAMLRARPPQLEARARDLMERICSADAGMAQRVAVIEVESRVGGGAAPGGELPSFAITIDAPRGASRLARQLRSGETPVIVRIADDRVTCDVRTILPDEEDRFVRAVQQALRNAQQGAE